MNANDPAGAPPTQAVRASDAERDRVGTVLREAAESGRLSEEELDERLAGLGGTKYRHELGTLTDDLPSDEQTSMSSEPGSVRAGLRALLGAIAGLFSAVLALAMRHKAIAALVIVLVAAACIAAVVFIGLDHGHPGGNGGAGGHRQSR